MTTSKKGTAKMSELAMTVKCTHCHRIFAGPSMLIVGRKLDAHNNRIAQFVQKLTEHMFTEHRQEAQQVLLEGNEYQGMLILSNFTTEDKSMKEQFDVVRWKVHQKTLQARFTDADIESWVGQVLPELMSLAQMNDKGTLQRNLVGMLQSIRDRLEEPNKYSFSPIEAVLTGTKQ